GLPAASAVSELKSQSAKLPFLPALISAQAEQSAFGHQWSIKPRKECVLTKAPELVCSDRSRSGRQGWSQRASMQPAKGRHYPNENGAYWPRRSARPHERCPFLP